MLEISLFRLNPLRHLDEGVEGLRDKAKAAVEAPNPYRTPLIVRGNVL